MKTISAFIERFKTCILETDLFQIVVAAMCALLLAGSAGLYVTDFGVARPIAAIFGFLTWASLFVLAIIQIAENRRIGK